MPDTLSLEFHFLRPLWLMALVPVAAIVILIAFRRRPETQWGDVIAPNLLKHLLVKPDHRWRIDPLYLVASGLARRYRRLVRADLGRELPPFVEDKAPLMVALSVAPSMNESDVAPTRLERAKQKVRDLLEARPGARTGLIAYSGTAHLVMPMTDDRTVIEPFLAALTPTLMPVQGNNAAAAAALAASLMAKESVAGTILLVADFGERRSSCSPCGRSQQCPDPGHDVRPNTSKACRRTRFG